MKKYQEIKGDLIDLALSGAFDVIVHGCNCFCKQNAGIAKQMVETFNTNLFNLENNGIPGEYDKLGNIEWKLRLVDYDKKVWESNAIGILKSTNRTFFSLIVVNAYTQYEWNSKTKPFDYEAFTMCLKKINHKFKDKTIGMPKIGSGLAGGNWNIIKELIQKYLPDCYVTIVEYYK